MYINTIIMPRGKTGSDICPKCNKQISLFAFNRHLKSCGRQPRSVIPIEKKKRLAWNKGLSKETDDRVLKSSNTLREKFRNGGFDMSYTRDPEYIKKCSERAKRLNFGGYQKNAGRSKKTYCLDSYNNEVCLQSSYEVTCSEVLNELKIKWVRPDFLFYDNRRYFPDFLLVDYNIYLDPKNDYLAKIDKDKIRLVCEQNNVKVYVLTKNQLNKEYILYLINNLP
jgi:hypothetical protein